MIHAFRAKLTTSLTQIYSSTVASETKIIPSKHLSHNKTHKKDNFEKKINIPWECEWPTTSVGADPLGFRIKGPDSCC